MFSFCYSRRIYSGPSLVTIFSPVSSHNFSKSIRISFCLDANPFSLSLSGRRDRGFYTYRQVCQFLFKLAQRCSAPKDLPVDQDWPDILNLNLNDTTALTITEFLSRFTKAERQTQETSNASLTLKALTNRNKEDFGRSARSYVAFLFNSMQKQKNLISDIVKGMGCFDLETLLLGPISHAVYCHLQRFTSFRLRGYFTTEQESESNEQYLSFLDDLDRCYPNLTQPTLLASITVKFLIDMPSQRNHPLLHKLFRLACLCLDEPFLDPPVVKFDCINSEDPASILVDVILPVQSYFSNYPHAIETLTADQSDSDFLRLEPEFGGRGLGDAYCP